MPFDRRVPELAPEPEPKPEPAQPRKPDRLQFFSNSIDESPGKGAGEYAEDPRAYAELESIPHWRRVLSNFHVHKFKYNGKTYMSIEHAFQAEKIALADPQKARLFALESGSELARGDGKAARKERKMVRLTKSQIQHWDRVSKHKMAHIALAKFLQCDIARRVLKSTGSAQLWHFSRGNTVRFIHLESLRDNL